MAEIALEQILTPAVFIAIGFILWNSSRKVATMDACILSQQKQIDQLKLDFSEKANALHKEIFDQIKTLELKISEAKAERKADITDAMEQIKKDLGIIQKQIDSIKIDIKEQTSRVEQNDTKIKVIDDMIKEIKTSVLDLRNFIAKWNQRIEDRIREIASYLMGTKGRKDLDLDASD